MKVARYIFAVAALALLVAALANPVRADQWNKETVVTINQPVEIPGRITLPAGTYVFKLLDSMANRHIVQIWNEDKTQLLTTILAIPNYRLQPTGETVINFNERPGVCPVALRAWFYPGDNFGQEFAYPKERAEELAEMCREVVPAETVIPTENTFSTVPLVAITPEKKEEPVTEAFQITPFNPPKETTEAQKPAAQVPVEKAEKLPQTGSRIPLVGLLGFAAIALGISLKLFAKMLS